MRGSASLVGIGGLGALVLAGCGGGPEPGGVTGSHVNGVLTGVLTGQAPVAQALTGKIAFESDRAGNYDDIYLMNADGSGVTRLTHNLAWDGSPAWSPDGSKIAFTRWATGPEDIYVMNADGGGVTRLTRYLGSDEDPAWSPDGSKIAFTSNRNDKGDNIYVMNAAGGGVTRLTEGWDYDSHPSWSPDGSKIAFESDRTGYGDIYVMNADGTGVTRLTRNAAEDFEPGLVAGREQDRLRELPHRQRGHLRCEHRWHCHHPTDA